MSQDTPQIAALYVQSKGAYFNLPGVDPWDQKRDARLYAGPYPVVAHPPCARWCRLAGLVEKRWGHKRGEDDGCFAAAAFVTARSFSTCCRISSSCARVSEMLPLAEASPVALVADVPLVPTDPAPDAPPFSAESMIFSIAS